jgi:glycosyltransferase involved in cell wall biosynthesis
MKVSVIIPTYNEEQYLPKLLDCLASQTMRDFEIIVADADSDDRTPEIASDYGAKVVPGGMPAAGRNAGAAAAQGDYYFFFDADVKFNKHFLARAHAELDRRYIDMATCETRPLSNVALDRTMHKFANLYVKLNQFTNPVAPGYTMMIHRRLFERVGGFDENVTHAEDFDLVRRASKLGKFRVLEDVHINVSVRRYRKEGRLAFIGHSLFVSWHRAFKGEITQDDFEYDFGNFEAGNDNATLRKIERRINKLNRRYNRLSKRLGESLSTSGNNAGLHKLQSGLSELYERFSAAPDRRRNSGEESAPEGSEEERE